MTLKMSNIDSQSQDLTETSLTAECSPLVKLVSEGKNSPLSTHWERLADSWRLMFLIFLHLGW